MERKDSNMAKELNGKFEKFDIVQSACKTFLHSWSIATSISTRDMFLWFILITLLTQPQFTRGKRLRSDDELTVMTDKGRVRGVRYYLPNQGKVVEAYLGIPFAEPPVGHLRFRHPVPKEHWDDVLNATRLANSCYQNPDEVFDDFYGSTMWNSPTRVSEDCLYLNVWVPKTHPRLRNAAVMVWIFGGGFYSGTTTLGLYDGKILAAENDIIVVSIAYRVGALGFLTLDHEEAPGNAGLFDQLMGLEWVQNNIKRFGGDPTNVTLFGESAGAVSVSMHLLSPLSRPKFQRAIMQSGAASTAWATYDAKEGKLRALELAIDYIGCEEGGMVDIAACLRSTDPQQLVDEQWISRGIIQFPFVPVVDGVFLIEEPELSLKRRNFKKCPIMIGSNRNEGSFFLIYEIIEHVNLKTQNLNRKQYLEAIDQFFFYWPQYRHESSVIGREAIAFEYSNWLNPNDTFSNFLALDQSVGDYHFVCHVNNYAHAFASAQQDVYYYYFTQRYRSNPWPPFMGVLHGDEILFIFGEPLKPGLNFTDGEKALSRQMMTYWTNFAKFGDPNMPPPEDETIQNNPDNEWPLHTAQGKEYMELNEAFVGPPYRVSDAIGRGPRSRQCAFWLEYLPQLMHATKSISKMEVDWKRSYQEWKDVHMADWKLKYDIFLRDANQNCPYSNDHRSKVVTQQMGKHDSLRRSWSISHEPEFEENEEDLI